MAFAVVVAAVATVAEVKEMMVTGRVRELIIVSMLLLPKVLILIIVVVLIGVIIVVFKVVFIVLKTFPSSSRITMWVGGMTLHWKGRVGGKH